MGQPGSRVLPEEPEPAWDVARLFPPQGSWSEEEYLALPGNHLTELDHGRFEAGQQAASACLPGFRVDVTTLFEQDLSF